VLREAANRAGPLFRAGDMGIVPRSRDLARSHLFYQPGSGMPGLAGDKGARASSKL
jgi:hypothetical protein